MLDLALYTPDQPGNTGTILRLGACLGLPVHIIEPCGFPLSDKALRRAGMDYATIANMRHHEDYAAFDRWQRTETRRLILLTTRARVGYCDFDFVAGDVLMVGAESTGVPDHVHEAVDHRVVVPMRPKARSLNVAISLAMVAGEALRQLGTSGNSKDMT